MEGYNLLFYRRFADSKDGSEFLAHARPQTRQRIIPPFQSILGPAALLFTQICLLPMTISQPVGASKESQAMLAIYMVPTQFVIW
jgi:hypothetical protein